MSPKNVTKSSAPGSPDSIDDSSRYSSLVRASSRMARSINSTAAGSQASASPVASIAASEEVKWPTAITRCRGAGTRATSAATTVTRVPSEPTRNLARSMPPGPPRPARRSSRYPPDWRQNRGYPVAMASAFRSASSGSSRQIVPSSDGRAARLATSAAVSGPKVTRLASERITSSESTWSTVMPYLTEWLPAELLPIIPPSVARLLVEVSGPNMSPCWAAARFNCSCTTPGWTRACRASPSIARIWFMCLEKSITTARPTACPARLVPAPRASTGTPNSAAVATTAAASSPSLGNTTPSGSIAYMLASREKRCRL